MCSGGERMYVFIHPIHPALSTYSVLTTFAGSSNLDLEYLGRDGEASVGAQVHHRARRLQGPALDTKIVTSSRNGELSLWDIHRTGTLKFGTYSYLSLYWQDKRR